MDPLLIFCLVILGLAWTSLNWIWIKPRDFEKRLREQGLKGNPYKILYGDFGEIKSQLDEAESKPISISDDIVPRVFPHFIRALQKFGKNSYIWLGPMPVVVILEPDFIKEITTKIDVFRRPQLNPLFKLLAQGIVSYDGEKWAKHRKLLTPAFHMEKLKLMLPAFYESTSEMLRKWEKVVSEGQLIEVDVWPHLQMMTSDVISRTAFGSSYEQGRKIFELQTEQVGHLMKASQSAYFPGMRFFPTKRNLRMKQIAKEVNDSIMKIVNARLKSMEAGKWDGDDLLGLLLESNSKESSDEHESEKSGMSMREVIEECKLFYFAGQETTSVLLVWTLVLLSRFQDWQSRAREEVFQVFGDTIKPDFDKLNQLKIVNMILHEVLRLYPPVPSYFRKVDKETKLGHLNLPAGVLVIIPTVIVHRDRNIWGDDAKEFKPERFAEGVSRATNGQVAFLPFNWGPRICIGQNFSMLEAKMAIALILQHFCFELSQSYSHAPYSNVTLQPQHGVHLILRRV